VQDLETPLQSERRFARLAAFSCASVFPVIPLLPSRQGPTKVHLPASGVPCSIGIAYQAADAGHPGIGVEQARRRASNLAVQFNSY